MKITYVALSFSGIESMETGQRRIEGFFQKPVSTGDSGEMEGQATIAKNSSRKLNTPLKRKWSESIPHGVADDGVATEDMTNQTLSVPSSPSYVCDRCGQRISLDQDAISNHVDGPIAGDDMQGTLARLRREHDDFHFAQDLSKGTSTGLAVKHAAIRPSESTGQGGSKKRKPETKAKGKAAKESKGGIAKFFTQR